ncbi:hypothetical protein ACFQER_07890 [Halomicroarcula sp. GCM10025894]|uniref:hypothetical protein n=1 Tax=Halomicroarcula sp. GCM10025894 TaxID=3252673 RepID=UPI00361253DD
MTEEFDTANSLLDPLPGEKVPYDKREAICDELPLGVPTSAVVPDAALELETILDDIHVNGGAHLGAVRVLPDERFDWALSRGSSRLLRRRVLSSAALAETLPELELSADRKHEAFDDIEWEHYPSYTLDGYLTENLVAGGAYYSFLSRRFRTSTRPYPVTSTFLNPTGTERTPNGSPSGSSKPSSASDTGSSPWRSPTRVV